MYADKVTRHLDLRKLTNDLVLDCFGNDVDPDLTLYTVTSTKDLIPPYIPTDYTSKDKFIIKAGLVLFHGTVHDRSLDFKYPTRGSFFATTPAHSLSLLCMEKRNDILNGMGYFSEHELQTTNKSYQTKIAARCSGLEDEEYDDCVDKLINERTPSTGRLLTYVLKRDITVRDAPGDSLSMQKCLQLDCDGVLAGYNSAYDHETSKDIFDGMNELRLCGDDIENYLVLVEERIIDPQELKHPFFPDGEGDSYKLVLNFVCPRVFYPIPDRSWLLVESGDSIMHLYFTMKYAGLKLDMVTMSMLFMSNSLVYYNIYTTDLVIMYRDTIKVTMFSDNMSSVWEQVKSLLDTYHNLNAGFVSQGLRLRLEKPMTIKFYDGFGLKLKTAGFPIDQYT